MVSTKDVLFSPFKTEKICIFILCERVFCLYMCTMCGMLEEDAPELELQTFVSQMWILRNKLRSYAIATSILNCGPIPPANCGLRCFLFVCFVFKKLLVLAKF